ncbi:MAG: sulfatase-like hydrolase/transferase [Flavobacteriaceae bacterium]|nr:sulfatase-like hydrolase/transferase [Flavobacteriaceae bacterium]
MKIKNHTYFKKTREILYDNFSLTILLLPYSVLNSLDNEIGIKFNLLFFLPLFILIDFALIKTNHLIKTILFSFTFYFFYSYLIYTDSYYYIQGLSFRYFSLILIIIFTFIFYKLSNKKAKNFLNVVILIYSLLAISNIFITPLIKIKTQKHNLKTDKIIFNSLIKEKEKTIILIVCDELGTSNEIFNITKSQRDLEFNNELESLNYLVKKDFFSHTKSTKISMASMLNFNLKNNQYIIEQEQKTNNFRTTTKLKNLIKYNLLTDSLNKFNRKVFSYGLLNFPMAKTKNNQINHLWGALSFEPFVYFFKNQSVISDFFYKSVLNFLDKRISLGNNFFDNSRKKTLHYLKQINFEKKSFYYFHFHAPHDPYSYFDEFVENKKINRFQNYINYRRFMLKKLANKLKLEKFKNTRIIIVGDHGLRDHNIINELNTFGAFYGFNKIDVEKIKSPQDISHLILHYLK